MTDLERLKDIRDDILSLVKEAGEILARSHKDHFYTANSFWIPQIVTAIRKDERWLSRGDHDMQETIEKISGAELDPR
jgi:hypothetical protein